MPAASGDESHEWSQLTASEGESLLELAACLVGKQALLPRLRDALRRTPGVPAHSSVVDVPTAATDVRIWYGSFMGMRIPSAASLKIGSRYAQVISHSLVSIPLMPASPARQSWTLSDILLGCNPDSSLYFDLQQHRNGMKQFIFSCSNPHQSIPRGAGRGLVYL